MTDRYQKLLYVYVTKVKNDPNVLATHKTQILTQLAKMDETALRYSAEITDRQKKLKELQGLYGNLLDVLAELNLNLQNLQPEKSAPPKSGGGRSPPAKKPAKKAPSPKKPAKKTPSLVP